MDGVLFLKDMTKLLCYPSAKPETQYVIPSSVTSISSGAFAGCSNLTTVTIPCSVSSNAFYGCSSLTSVTILQGAYSINSYAFGACYELKSIVVPGSLTDISSDAFKNCVSLSSITITANNKWAIQYFKNNGFEFALNYIPDQMSYCAISQIDDQSFTGKKIEPDVSVYYGTYYYSENRLVKGTDYTLSYTNNINTGTATVTAKGIGNYTGTLTATFKILSVSLDNYSFSYGEINNQTYTGKALKPDLKITFDKYKLKKNKDYTLTYKNNKKVGTATITIKGKGNFTGKVTRTFYIVPKTVQLLSLTTGEEYLTVKWKKGTDITGYELQWGRDKKFYSHDNNYTFDNAKTTQADLYVDNFASGTTYYFRIRTYKKIKDQTYYSEWSKVKSIKVKKTDQDPSEK